MKKGWKRAAALLAALGLMTASAGAELPEGITETDGWHFDEKGFLVGENPGDAYISADEKGGHWRYADRNLSVTVTRYEEDAQQPKRTVAYCVAEVYASEASPLTAIMTPAGGKRPGGYKLQRPDVLVREYPAVLAVSDDFFGYRQYTRDLKGSRWPTGIIIRDGEILYDKTRDSSKKRDYPPLDTLAVYEDGSMKTYVCDEKTAEEYLAEGARQVFSFGPILLRDGEPDPAALTATTGYNTMKNNATRTAIGMIEPFHYILLVVGLPSPGKNVGVNGDWLVEKMRELGCTEALNLDGGGTTTMAFNGKIIMHGDGDLRPSGSMIAFGKKEKLLTEPSP